MPLEQLDLNRLHTFFAVAEHGGVTAAARRLALTPSAVSQSLAKFEASLSLQLFDRVGRRLVLTREGRLLYSRFREHQERLRETLEEIIHDREVRGVVRVGLFLGFPRAPLAKFLASFTNTHPEVTLRMIYGSQNELDEGLEAGRVDFAFALGNRPRPRTTAGSAVGGAIAAVHLFEQELVLECARNLYRARFECAALRSLPIIWQRGSGRPVRL